MASINSNRYNGQPLPEGANSQNAEQAVSNLERLLEKDEEAFKGLIKAGIRFAEVYQGVNSQEKTYSYSPSPSYYPSYAYDALFWTSIGRHHYPDYSWSYYSYHPIFLARDCCLLPCSNCRGCDERAVVVAAVAFVVLSDLAAVIGAGVFTYKAIKEAYQEHCRVREEAAPLKEAATLEVINPGEETEEEMRNELKTVSEKFSSISSREAIQKKVQAVYKTVLAIGGALSFHAFVSLIACLCIKASAAAMATLAGVKAVAFFSACFSPPVLIAIAVIVFIGISTYAAHHYYQNKYKPLYNRKDAELGLNALARIAQIRPNPASQVA